MNRWPITRYLLSTHYIFLILILVGFYAACGVLLTTVALLSNISISTVDVAAQVLCWLALAYGTSATTTLGTVLVHGRTRREFLAQYPAYLGLSALTLAALITLVYAGETALYSAFDWPQKLQDHRVYESASDYPVIFVTYLSMLLMWLLAGAVIGAGIYRWEANGIVVTVPFAAVVLLVTGGFNGFFSLVPFLRAGTTDLAVILAVTLVAAAATWAVFHGTVRDVALRIKFSA
ncbi:hypothetical protein AB0M02_21715 [Actinoplanes sp. NPDC051861]|uniref:hypothetical protein n=1 Tax=Actinoplanes sp. NPDC051861 TaxID=3155170 RepID=UPI0034326A78